MLLWIKKHLPTAKDLINRPSLHWIKNWLTRRPYLWKFTKHSVAGSIAISLFTAFLPLPFEMLTVTLLAILFRVNLPIAILSTWITNPFTLIPANYFSYKVGAWILYTPANELTFPDKLPFSWHHWQEFLTKIPEWLSSLGKPYLIGLPVVSITVAFLSYIIIYGLLSVIDFVRKHVKKKKRR